MKIYLCDREYTARDKSKWHNALTSALANHFNYAETCDWNEPNATHPAYSDRDAVLLCHSSGAEANWRTKADDSECHIVLVRGDGRQDYEKNARGNLHGCHWSPDDFVTAAKQSSPQRLALWLQQARTKSPSDVQWSLLRPAPTERLWALRLLCEAFLETRTKPNVEGIKWLRLLGDDDEPPITSDDEVIKKIRADYDDLSPNGSTAISTFLDSLKSGAPTNAADVRECLNKLNSVLGVSAVTTAS